MLGGAERPLQDVETAPEEDSFHIAHIFTSSVGDSILQVWTKPSLAGASEMISIILISPTFFAARFLRLTLRTRLICCSHGRVLINLVQGLLR